MLGLLSRRKVSDQPSAKRVCLVSRFTNDPFMLLEKLLPFKEIIFEDRLFEDPYLRIALKMLELICNFRRARGIPSLLFSFV